MCKGRIFRFLSAFTLSLLAACGPSRKQEEAAARYDAAPPPRLPAPAITPAFWNIWGDGKAELAAYDYRTPRYGALRQGVSVLIFVTEPFLMGPRVKSETTATAGDAVPVMKLNRIDDFATGIYDYNLMTSIFVPLAPVKHGAAGTPAKITFSGQEWCGHVWHQLLFDHAGIRETSFSYFEREADQSRRLDYPADGFAEDVLLLWARGMAAPSLDPGQTMEVSFLPSLREARLEHQPLAWKRVKLSRHRLEEPLHAPAGRFLVDEYLAESGDGVVRRVWVERAPPHRIVGWETSYGERAELLSATRAAYWQMNAPGGEAALKLLGLRPRPPRTP